MSGVQTTTTSPPPPAPRWLPPIRVGEIDGRYMNCKPDLGVFGDTFTGIGTIAFTITRQDGQPTTSADLQQAGTAWPNTLDATGLIPTMGLMAPSGSVGVSYAITQTVSLTAQGRLFIRDWFIEVARQMG